MISYLIPLVIASAPCIYFFARIVALSLPECLRFRLWLAVRRILLLLGMMLTDCVSDPKVVYLLEPPDGSPDVTVRCEGGPHESGHLVVEPDGTYTCLPGPCDPGWADCDGNPENGCEASLLSPEHCASCATRCTAAQHCYLLGCH